MRIFNDRTKVDVPGLHSFQQPVVFTEVVRYRPESCDDACPTILYTKTEVWREDSPFWVMKAITDAAKAGLLKDPYEQAVVWTRDAKVIRQAIKRHDETVSLVRDILTAAAGRKEKEE